MTGQTTSPASGRAAPKDNRSSAKRMRSPCRQQFTAAGPGRSAAGSDARRQAVVILEVLAGVQTPTSAAQALGIGLPRYYILEQRALGGLVAACEPRPQGRTVSSDRRIARLERELAVCRRELGRQQALARVSQRVLGLKAATVPTITAGKPSAPGKEQPANVGTGAKKSRRRKPVARALRAARVLQAGVLTADCSPTGAVGEVQISAGDAPPTSGGNHLVGPDAACLETPGAQGG